MSISLLSVLSPCPNPAEQPRSSPPYIKRGYMEACNKVSLKPKKRQSRRSAPKYTRSASREQVQPRKARKKAPAHSRCASSSAGSEEEEDQRSTIENDEEPSMPLKIPRIDIVQASPTIGSKSPTPNSHNILERSPSMPAVLPEQTPEYMTCSKQIFKPALTRPLTSPSRQTGETGSATSTGWGCNGAGSSGRIPMLPLPGTPVSELSGHNFTSPQEERGAPLHTCATDTTQSVPTTFHFQDTITSRSTSFPRKQPENDRYTPYRSDGQALSSNGSKTSSRSTSISSSVSRVTNQVRILRITNPDPPSPVRSAAPSRTPSMTIAQKRFVSCPPAPLQVERANGYKTLPNKTSSCDSPVSRSTESPTSSSNSASTPSFRFSDGGTSPASVATPTSAASSLPATPTKLPAGAARPADLKHDHKTLYSSARAAAEVAKTTAVCTIAPPNTRTLETKDTSEYKAATATQARTRIKTDKKRRMKVKRSKSNSSRDADNSEGVESCFESIGAPSEWEYIAPRKKRSDCQVNAKSEQKKTKTTRKKIQTPSRSPAVSEAAETAVKQEKPEDVAHMRARLFFQPPKSPLVLSKPQVVAALDVSNDKTLENLTTFWTPIGRVIVAPVPSACASGLKLPSAPIVPQAECSPQDNERAPELKQLLPTRAFLVPPRSPRPPNTRRLGHNDRDPLSRSELHPPRNTKQDALLAPPAACNVQNPALSLSLPLPSPMRLDAFTSDLLARCGGVGNEPDAILAELIAVPPRRRSVDEGIKEGAKTINEQIQVRRMLPSPGDPFIASPTQMETYKFPKGKSSGEGQEASLSHSRGARPPLTHTHPATLRPSTPTQVNTHVPPTPSIGRYFSQTPPTPHRESTGHKRYVSLPVPPPLPPRRRNALPDVSVLREQLVANGALVSGDEGRGKYERTHENIEHHHEPEKYERKDHRSHRHKTATILEKDDLIIPIQKAFPDGIGMMEYERARSLRDAQMKAQIDHMASLTSQAIPATSHNRVQDPRHQTVRSSPCAKPVERSDRHTNVTSKGVQGYYCEEKGRSGFEMLQRQSEENGYIRERGQERGRERNRRLPPPPPSREQHQHQHQHQHQVQLQGKAMMQPEIVEQEEEDGEQNGAIRLGEHKRGFDTGEIERWLEGLKKASLMKEEEEDEEDRRSFF